MSEKPPIMAVRRGDFLAPLAPLDSELMRAYPAGKPLKVAITQPRRSLGQNRLYWSLLGLVVANLDQDVTDDDLHDWFKRRLGVTKEIKLRSGAVETVTRSTSFDSMPHAEFTEYMRKVKALITEHLIPRADSEAFEREARLMLGEAA